MYLSTEYTSHHLVTGRLRVIPLPTEEKISYKSVLRQTTLNPTQEAQYILTHVKIAHTGINEVHFLDNKVKPGNTLSLVLSYSQSSPLQN